MKYCSKCKKVYPDGTDCECTKEKHYNWEEPSKMIELDCEPVCKCGSTEKLRYHPKFKYTFVSLPDSPAYCRCQTCQVKIDKEAARQESMKYLIFDSYQDETTLCDEKDEVEEFLKYYTEDSEFESGPLNDVLILKLEPFDGNLKESDFKPQRVYKDGEFMNLQEPNTHVVVWDGEVFRVEEVIVPEIEYDGGRSISW